MSVKLLAPNKAAKYVANGVTYTPDDYSILTVPADAVDDLLAQGCYYPPAASGVKNNLAATAAPAVTNDVTEGYGVGSIWLDTTNDIAYLCLDGTEGAALWRELVAVAGAQTISGAKSFAETLAMTVAAKTLQLKQGANGKTGTVTLNGATPVAVGNTSITANSGILFTLKTVGGTVSPNAPNVLTITPGTGFTVAGTALDTSVYNYHIIESAA